MHLDKLELLGFKSFPEKTNLKFSTGISCIVGPNGCGKTNILDAIRWVLGETRMSILRGGKLEEVIFSGTRDMKPLGMAEVNLTILNDRGVLATPYNQVTVTRRLYRSGDSEFFINKVPCRRKDITEMFYDTGLTSGTYSVIEQDMIDIILSDKAEDRRHFFEEAAGITKYKQRKKEALRKLENTAADLMRLEDLYTEVSSQANSLKRQVSKAERHKRLKDEIEKIGIELAIDRWLNLEERGSELKVRGGQIQAELDETKSKINVLELDREKTKLDIAEKENSVKAKREKLARLTEQLHTIEKNISVLREKTDNTKNRHHLTLNELESLESKQESLHAEIEKAKADSEEYSNQVRSLERQVEDGEEKLSGMTSSAQEISNSYENIQTEIKSLSREVTQNQESQITLDLKYSTGLEKIDEIRREIGSAEEELNSLNSEKERLQNSKHELLEKIGHTSEQRRSNLDQLEQLRNQQDELKQEQEKLSSDYHHLKAEIELAGKVIHQYEGYTSGAAQIGQIKEQFPGIIDTVANLINPEPEYVNCVQTVLGELSNYFVVDTKETARNLLAYGLEQKLGRFGLIILENIPRPSEPEISFPTNPNIIGQLSDYVSSDEKYSGMVKYLFRDILIVRSLFDEPGLEGFDMVSPQGEMLDFQKSLAIGGTEEILLVGQKARFDELNQRHNEIEINLETISNEIRGLNKKQSELTTLIESDADILTGLKEELASISTNLSQNELKIKALSTQLAEKRQAGSEIENRIKEIDSEKTGLDQVLDSKRTHLSELEGRVAHLKERLNAATLEKDEFSRSLSNLKMKLFSAESSLQTTENNYRRLTELQIEIEHSIEEKSKLLGQLLFDITRFTREIKSSEEEIEQVYKQREDSSSILMQAEGEITGIATNLNNLDKSLKQLRQKSEELSDRLHEINMKMNSHESQREKLAEETLDRYNYDLNAQSRMIRFDDDERAEKEETLLQQKNKLESLGPVNLLALDEYEQTKSRADFLKNQIDDLNKAKDDLKTTISRINSTARKKFLETFEIVKENFQNVFCELFEGGEATLRLEENADPLETPIHISARPRGKKLLSIHQLSGGERALTATALLFSFYMVKPSPFCILDEVDAPLDDANIGRFLKLVKRFTEETQFIIITHNKLTMEQAETLYGITMSRPGISQIVSVDLKKRGERLDIEEELADQDGEEESPQGAGGTETEEAQEETEQEVEVNR
ncbi:MAG TPA: chromosome segregation protein SMC [candidate division Zixibacteria bacterium]|mgnify:CR=1 FL=1|nr:chromosome segregation protein SMC [candidate division Zixibacteria bacterium]